MVVLEEGYVVKFYTNDHSKIYLYIERSKAGAINAMMECCEHVLDLEYGQHAYIECFENGNSLYKTNFLHFLKVDILLHSLTFRPQNEDKFSFWNAYLDNIKIDYNDEEKDLKLVLWELLEKEIEFDALEQVLLQGISFSNDFLIDLPDLFVYDDFPLIIDAQYFSDDEEENDKECEFIEGLNIL
jgi:hypothetical protein